MADTLQHPEHIAMTQSSAGHWVPAIPLRCSWWLQRKIERACRKAGGHWWHPHPDMTWRCCQCAAISDYPRPDGT